jgi:hypothetical protein
MKQSRPSRSTRALGGLAAVLLTALALAGCSSDDSAGGSTQSAGESQDRAVAGDSLADAPAEAPGSAGGRADAPADPVVAQTPRSLIRTGTVALRSDDVARARFDVQKVVDAAGGEIGEETTSADDDGEAELARLVVRVPASRFAQTMAELEKVADLISTDTMTEDVTTQVIDTDVRVKLQRRSIERISLLLERAGSLRDIIRIEQELARREADLASLEQQQAYLDDQTSFSTITVSLERPEEAKKKDEEDTDDAGFVAGLKAGWSGLTAATTAGLTVVGALLPFAAVVVLVGGPVLLLVRRRTRRPASGPVPSPSQPSP